MSKFGDLIRGKASTPAPTPAPVVEETPVKETTDVPLESMSKKELEAYGRTVGIELDRRHSKKDLVKELKEVI